MSWYVQVDQSVTTHRKTLKLARLLSESRYCVVGRLVALWGWSLDSAVDGALADVDAEMLADVMGYQGKPAELFEALLSAGFLDIGSDGLVRIHNWYARMGQFVEQREQRREQTRQASQRYRDRQKAQVQTPLHLAQADVVDDTGHSSHGHDPHHGHAVGGVIMASSSRHHDASSSVIPKSSVKKRSLTERSNPPVESERERAHADAPALALTPTRARTRGYLLPLRFIWRQIQSQWYLELQMGITTLLVSLALLLLQRMRGSLPGGPSPYPTATPQPGPTRVIQGL
jgi:hypothetical protein